MQFFFWHLIQLLSKEKNWNMRDNRRWCTSAQYLILHSTVLNLSVTVRSVSIYGDPGPLLLTRLSIMWENFKESPQGPNTSLPLGRYSEQLPKLLTGRMYWLWWICCGQGMTLSSLLIHCHPHSVYKQQPEVQGPSQLLHCWSHHYSFSFILLLAVLLTYLSPI